MVNGTNVRADRHNLFVLYPYFYKERELPFSFFGSLMYYSYICSAKLLQKSEMRKDIVIELSYKGFG